MGGPTTDRDAAAASAGSTPTVTGREADGDETNTRERNGAEDGRGLSGPASPDATQRWVE